MGQYQRVSGAATAGNANLDLTVSDNTSRRMLHAHVSLTTDATVANRRVILSVLDASATVVARLPAGAVVTASLAAQAHEFFPGAARETALVSSALMIPSPELILLPGWKIRISIENGVAGDSFTAEVVFDQN